MNFRTERSMPQTDALIKIHKKRHGCSAFIEDVFRRSAPATIVRGRSNIENDTKVTEMLKQALL